MDSRSIHSQPNKTPGEGVGRKATQPQQRHRLYDTNANGRQGERAPLDVLAVANGYDQNCAYIVDDRQWQHEYAQTLRDARPEKRQATHDECRIRGHDRTPSHLASSPFQKKVQHGRH